MAIIKYITPTMPTRATDGFVPYRNGSAIAMRSRSYPKRVTSTRHMYTVQLISELSIYWENPLTNSDRAGWGAYAFGTPLVDAWGMPRYVRGYAHYMRSNRPRLQFGLSRIDTPPSTLGLPTFTLYGFGLNANSTIVSVYFESSESWVHTDGAFVLLWVSYLTKRTRNLPTEVYRPFRTIAGSSTSPPSSPSTFPLYPTPGITSGRTFLRASLTLPDGRLSV